MDDVKRLLEQFADRSVDALPPADVEADLTRGRRALRRIRARRRVTGVLCAAAATAAALVAGEQAQWRSGGEAEVATDAPAPAPETALGVVSAGSPTPAVPTSASMGTPSLLSDSAVQLVSNGRSWNSIGCTLVPQGWTAAAGAERVVLTPPSARTADATSQLELFAADQSQPLSGVRAVEASGRVIHLGSTGGRAVGQVKLGERWLVVRLPAAHQAWNDETLRRFLGSCTIS
ncbi:hypothetical protein Kfla_4719 [Kribbella flavida DSM 17836]|uniref:Uncharacterized protein n=1 Tax=Kribbella flavida (strain DSM 17836 / JCM 10339 / NBRC 14399) TaxID=479435 RepID=D2PZC7_KRIFD|nr:hypothetical protein [Kribbella flavida]ADB33736.1 hypothetical protein Kfla_4719 [Kribbella flavida DSM 17836]